MSGSVIDSMMATMTGGRESTVAEEQESITTELIEKVIDLTPEPTEPAKITEGTMESFSGIRIVKNDAIPESVIMVGPKTYAALYTATKEE